MTRPAKRSLTLHGHRTSVSLEDEFWQIGVILGKIELLLEALGKGGFQA